jgi:glycosyltransferase involved in cell wall biosynthesis
MEALACRCYRQTTLWHVDVVDYFNRLYLGRILPPEKLTRAYDLWEGLGLGGLLPEILKLVFRKQKAAVRCSSRLIVPSRGMAETLQRCYGEGERSGGRPLSERTLVVPWGVWEEEGGSEGEAEEEAGRLRALHRIGPGTRVLMTLSRISPEKGIDILLKALRLLEGESDADICLFVCGEPAFMRGASYARKVRALAGRLRRVRVFFPGYLGPARKKAYLRLADLFISPSIHESYGLSVVEAMKAGLPVLASDHYGVKEELDASYGLVVPCGAGRPERAFARALAGLLADPARLERMGVLAREAAGRMSFDRSAERVLTTALGAV